MKTCSTEATRAKHSDQFVTFPLQEKLDYIGPEEFVQAFVQKRPADNHKVSLFPQHVRARVFHH